MDSSPPPPNHYLPEDEDLTTITSFTPPPLPNLTNEAQTIPDSCLSLSVPFLQALRACLPPAPALSLSIGSGTGLVEALLQSLPDDCTGALNLVSVEVAPTPNKYHAPHRTVPGTWALEPSARNARAWLFVYPKQVALVRAYMTALHGADEGPETVVYVGPRMDWDDFRGAFEGVGRVAELWDEEKMEAAGGRAWECVAVLRRGAGSASASR